MYMYRYALKEIPVFNPFLHKFANEFKKYNSYLEFYEDSFRSNIDSKIFLETFQTKYTSKILEYKNRFKNKKIAIFVDYKIKANRNWGENEKIKSMFYSNIRKFIFNLDDINYEKFIEYANIENFDREESSQY